MAIVDSTRFFLTPALERLVPLDGIVTHNEMLMISQANSVIGPITSCACLNIYHLFVYILEKKN